MFKELTKEKILEITPSIDADCLKLCLDIEEQRKKAYEQGYKDALKTMKGKN